MPGGSALAVDREVFSRAAARAGHGASAHHRGPGRGGRASEPRASSPPARSPRPRWPRRSPRGSARRALAFYDAIAPIVSAESLDHERAVRAVALRQGRRRRLPQRADGPAGLRGVHRRADRRRPVHRRTSSTRCRTSRAACRWRRWRAAGGRRSRFGPMKPVGLPDPAHRPRAVRRGPAAPRGPRGADVEPGRLPDPAPDPGAAEGVPR